MIATVELDYAIYKTIILYCTVVLYCTLGLHCKYWTVQTENSRGGVGACGYVGSGYFLRRTRSVRRGVDFVVPCLPDTEPATPPGGVYTAERMPDEVRNRTQAVRRELSRAGERGGGEETDSSPTLRMEWMV